MKKEDAVCFARESGVWEYASTPDEKAEQYLRFAKLVEQETLERAAKVCDAESFDAFERESRTRSAGDDETAYEHSIEKLAYAYVAKEIRLLKGSHE